MSSRTGKNLTERLSEGMMQFLVQWAWLYVDRFGADIVESYTIYSAGMKRVERSVRRMPNGEPEARLRRWLDQQVAQRRPLPGHNNAKGEVNIHRIAAAAGVTNYVAYSRRSMIEDYVRLVGTDGGFFDTPVSIIKEAGVPWREPFDEVAVLAEAGHLMIACYIICAFLSGMRDCETQSVRRGSLEVERDAFGEVVRYRIVSDEHKGRTVSERRTWVVIEPVARAIAILERLLDVLESGRSRTRSPYLFQQARCVGRSLGQTVNQALVSFIGNAANVLQPRLAALRVPPLKVADEKVTTRKLRRTTSWFIANRPFGTLAGMIQYGHQLEVTFEGYAGTSPTGFHAEVQLEKAAARRRDIVDMFEDHRRGVRVAGPMAETLAAEFDGVAAGLATFPGKVVDDRRRAKMLEHLRVRLFPGLLTDCFFEAEHAECLREIEVRDRLEPVVGVCNPKCRNACWTRAHAGNWRRAISDVQALGRRNRISPMQRKIVRRKQAEYETILAEIVEAAGGRT